MSAYYNEHDAEKAEWIRELIKAGVTAPGDVDERSILDVRSADLAGYTQCHFFAGIGVWSYALRLAGWPDEKPVWTGSCPCPSFSTAGKGEGFDDPRHLWPEWYRLIRECRPGTVFGEQVAAAIGHGWLDLVCGDMEAEEYAIAAAVLGAHSAGSPHIRQRLYYVAERENAKRIGRAAGSASIAGQESRAALDAESLAGKISVCARGSRPAGSDTCRDHIPSLSADATSNRSASGIPEQAPRQEGQSGVSLDGSNRSDRGDGWLEPESCAAIAASGATRGFWADCDWWYGRDGKYRPIGPGLQPLAHGAPARVLRLRGYGDAICSEAAETFIEAFSSIHHE